MTSENRLRDLRKRLGLTAEEIARGLNISTGYYYKLERGEKRLNVDHLNNLARFMNTSVDYLLNLDDREEIFPESSSVRSINGGFISMLPVVGNIGRQVSWINIEHNCLTLDFHFYIGIKLIG
jgi:transcriptional regulator with XRE-family HTH domain